MRVVAGSLGGRRLLAPAGRAVRPTSDRVREALFSMLDPVEGAVVLDLFAGSGALGIEALSRGAARATFVELSTPVVKVLEDNLRTLQLGPEQVTVRRADARAALREASARGEEYDLVFLDPPYRHAAALAEALFPAITPVLAPGARVVCECDRRAPLELGLPLARERRYGDTLIRIYQYEPQAVGS
jgi:16S rRNA (guanine966-N2)-methyltransferase